MGFTGALGGCNSCRQPAKLGGLLQADVLCLEKIPTDMASREHFIRSFDFRHYLDRLELPPSVDPQLVLRETVRFMLLTLHGIEFELRAPLVDRVWHEMILDSPRYFEFCRRAFGAYLHHAMTGADPDCEPNFKSMLAEYQRQFGESPPPMIWDMESMLLPSSV